MILKSVNILWPVPATDEPSVDIVGAYGPSPDGPELAVTSSVWGGEGGDVDGVSNRLITGRVDHVAQCLLGILDAATLGVSVPQEDQLLLLPSPESTHTLSVHL